MSNDKEEIEVDEKKGFKPARRLVIAMIGVLFGASALMGWYIHRTGDPAKMQRPEQAERTMQR